MIGTSISHYTILEKIGEGGMGVVYKARDTRLDRLVAVKFLPRQIASSEQDKSRFINEAKAAASLNHPNICTIYGIEDHDDQLFIVMELVEGDTLRQRVSKAPVPAAEIVSISTQAAEGLKHAHAKGIIHRDIKSENLMLTGDGQVKIMDFGLALVAGRSRLFAEETMAGTVAYMSPEQIRGETLDARSDIWSLGVTMYEAATSRIPFEGQYEQAVIYLILNESPPPPSEFVPEIPVRMESIIRKSLEKDVGQRYRDAQELLDALAALREEISRGTATRSGDRRSVSDKAKPALRSSERERRLVTILLSALTNVDKLYESGDSDSAATIVSDCLKGLASIIAKYDGTTEKLSAEHGLMATFGAPVAHEDDPERAVRCSLEMRSYVERFNSLQSIPVPSAIGLTVAIHSGNVVAGGDSETGYSVMGEAVTVAAGMLNDTGEGEICLSGDTLRIVERLVETGEARSVRIRGRSQPVEVRQLSGIRQESASRTDIGKGAFIGRAKETVRLKESLEAVLTTKEVRLFLSGEPGVGKSRLSDELLRLAGGKGMPAYVGKCSSFEIDTPYYLWNTLLKSVLHLGLDAGEQETRTRLHDLLQILSLESEEPYLATLLSLRYEEILLEVDETRKRRIFDATRKLLTALAQRKPCVFILEDLHWIDRFSQALLDFIFTEPSVAPALFFFIFRPEYDDRVVQLHGELIDLDRLSVAEASDLVKSHFNVGSIPGAVERILQKRTEGNPFFVEEMVRTLLDRGMIAIRKGSMEIVDENLEGGIPETVQGVIMARIDRLEGHIRDVLLDASVIGREFSKPVLEHVASRKSEVVPGLQQLRTLEFILEKEQAREFEYLFKHYLIQEVAYNTLLADKRKKLHGLIAKAIEHLYQERLKDFYEVLAFHYENAEQWDKAAEYLNRAGRKISEIFSKEESNGFFKRKDEALEKLYESKSESRTGWLVLSFIIAAIAAPLAVVMIAIPYYLTDIYLNLPSYIQFSLFGSEFLGNVAFLIYLLALCIGYPVGALVFMFFGVIPALRKKPKLYDLWEDQIRVVFGPKKAVSIRFDEVEEIRFEDGTRREPFGSRLLDPRGHMPAGEAFTMVAWLRRVFLRRVPRMLVGALIVTFMFFLIFPALTGIRGQSYIGLFWYKPGWMFVMGLLGASIGFLFRLPAILTNVPAYSFGFSSRRGQVIVRRTTGWNRMRLLFPWLHTAMKSQVVGLTPSDPKEFFEQQQIAYAKWRRRQGQKDSSGGGSS